MPFVNLKDKGNRFFLKNKQRNEKDIYAYYMPDGNGAGHQVAGGYC